MYGRLGERLGIKDHSTVLNLIVNKVASNLRLYGGCDDIIQATLTMFQVRLRLCAAGLNMGGPVS